MKQTLFFSLLVLTCNISVGQNLVPNGDFESYSGCPTNLTQIDSALFWTNPSTVGTPDYFNQCAVGVTNVPNAIWGYQQAHSGVAYCGIALWDSLPYLLRERIQTPLTTTLVAGECYHFEMFVNLANLVKYSTDDIAVYFSDTLISGVGNWYFPQIYFPQINNSGTPFDSLNWTLAAGDYTAAGGENYLIIANFKFDSATSVVVVNNSSFLTFSYVYIDDVSLTHCVTGINELNNNNFAVVYPNPVSTVLTIETNTNELNEFILYDIASRELLRHSFTKSISVDMEQLAKGIYIYEVTNKKGLCKQEKIVKD
ncbi:hypothetical protein BH11BAC1_BH11BAC1_09380 [soil metagenome]